MEERVKLVLNGPSLSESIDEVLSERSQSIVVNHFADSDHFDSLRPEFYVIQDSYFWRPNVLKMYLDKREKTYKLIAKKTNWPLTLFLPSFADIDFVKDQIDNPNLRIVVYNAGHIFGREKFSYVQCRNWLFYLWRKNICAPPPKNVLVGATYVAYLSGAKDISIYGADMSVFKGLEVNQEDNAVGIWEEHFYGKDFYPRYKDKEGRMPTTMSHELQMWSKVFWAFEVLNLFYVQNGVRVINKSSFSYVDAFKRE